MSRHFVIIGAGISGLALGWYLQQQNNTVTILEKRNHAGGWIQTSVSEGFLFEHGPRSLRPNSTTLELIQALNLQDEVIQADPSAKKRFLCMNKELHSVPYAFLGSLMRGVWKDFRTKPSQSMHDESVHCFFSRRFGIDIADTIGDAMIAGVFAGDPKCLSLKSCFPILHQWEQDHGSVIKGMFKEKRVKGSIYSFRNGMQTLVDTLASHLDIHYSSAISHIESLNDSVKITLSNNTTLFADNLIFAVPPSALAQLIPELSADLEEIPSTTVATVNFGYREQLIKRKGFGYLIPSGEKEKILGVVFDSCAFPEQNRHPNETRLTVMLGGARDPEVVHYNSHTLESMALQGLENHLGITTQPDAIQVRVAQKAIPQYVIGHTERINRIEKQLRIISPKFTLAGNGFYGIAINDCIKKAKDLASFTT